MQTSILLAFVALALPAFVQSQTCTSTTCSEACSLYDDVLASCAGVADAAFANCSCSAINGLNTDVGLLNDCVACNDPTYGGITAYYIYQSQTVICDVYLVEGNDAAQSIGAVAETAIVSQFSASYLPIIQSKLCTGSGVNTGAGTAVPSTAGTAAVAASQAATGKTTGTTGSTTITAAATNLVPSIAGGTAATTASSLSSGLTYSVLTSPLGSLSAGATVVVTKNAAATHCAVANMALLAVPIVGALL